MHPLRFREPVSRLFYGVYRLIPGRVGLLLVFLLVSFLSGIGNLFYRAYVSPESLQRFATAREIATKHDTHTIVSNPILLRSILPQESEGILLPIELAFQNLTSGDDDLQAFRERWVSEAREALSRDKSSVYGTIVAYWFFDPGMLLDKILLRPLLIVILFLAILRTSRSLQILSDPNMDLMRDIDGFSRYSSRIHWRVINSRNLIRSSVLVGLIMGVQHYYTYGRDPSKQLGLLLIDGSLITLCGLAGIAIVLTCADTEQSLAREKAHKLWTAHKCLGISALGTCLLGIFLHGPYTELSSHSTELMKEMFHYNRFQRFFADYYTTFGLMVLLALLYLLPRAAKRFGLRPNFDLKQELYGFSFLVDLVGIGIFTIMLLLATFVLQLSESSKAPNNLRLEFFYSTARLALFGLCALLIGFTLLVVTVMIFKNRELKRLKELEAKLAEDSAGPEKARSLRAKIEEARNLTTLRILLECIRRPWTAVSLVALIFPVLLSYLGLLKIFALD